MSPIHPPIPDLGPIEAKPAPLDLDEIVEEIASPEHEPEIPTSIRIYTDGSILKNPGGAGGWAFVVVEDEKLVEVQSGGVPVSTNNRMELTAMLEAMRWVGDQPAIEIISDSLYVVNGITEWMPEWRRKGWHKVKNLDLWHRVEIIYRESLHTITWTRGHDGHRWNELADRVAGESARAVRDAL